MQGRLYILMICVFLLSAAYADVEFLERPPKEVKVFPGQTVILPCVLEDLEESQTVEWSLRDHYSFIISQNRKVENNKIENYSEHLSLIGSGMNFTLVIKIPGFRSLNFGNSDSLSANYKCSVIDEDEENILSVTTSVFIQNWTFIAPICVAIKNNYYYSIGDVLPLGCFNPTPDEDVFTTLVSSKGKILQTKLNTTYQYNIYDLNITREDNNTEFICESIRKGTNEIRSCSVGPIIVKPDIIDIPTVSTTLQYTTDMVTEEMTNMLKIHTTLETITAIRKSTVEYTTITDNYISIETVGLNSTQPSNDSKIEITNEGDKPGLHNQEKESRNDISTGLLVTLIILFCVVIIFLTTVILFFRQRNNKKTQINQNDNHRDEKENPTSHIYEYLPSNMNDFQDDYEEMENEIYIDGNDLTRNKNDTRKIDQYIEKENEIYEGAETDSKLHVYFQLEPSNDGVQPYIQNEAVYQYIENDAIETDLSACYTGQRTRNTKINSYSVVRKPSYKECENEIYEGAD